jgi:hypothetical protein
MEGKNLKEHSEIVERVCNEYYKRCKARQDKKPFKIIKKTETIDGKEVTTKKVSNQHEPLELWEKIEELALVCDDNEVSYRTLAMVLRMDQATQAHKEKRAAAKKAKLEEDE